MLFILLAAVMKVLLTQILSATKKMLHSHKICISNGSLIAAILESKNACCLGLERSLMGIDGSGCRRNIFEDERQNKASQWYTEPVNWHIRNWRQ